MEGDNEKQEVIFCLIYFHTCIKKAACHAVLVRILAPSKEHAHVLTFAWDWWEVLYIQEHKAYKQ